MSVKHAGQAVRSAVLKPGVFLCAVGSLVVLFHRARGRSVASIGWLSLTLAACVPMNDLGNATLPFAINTASRQHRPLIVELSANWCEPCQVFATKVLTDPRVQQALADVVFVSYDIDMPPGRDAMNRCRVASVPAVFGIDGYGYIRLRKIGGMPTADEFLAFIRQAHEVLAAPAL